MLSMNVVRRHGMSRAKACKAVYSFVRGHLYELVLPQSIYFCTSLPISLCFVSSRQVSIKLASQEQLAGNAAWSMCYCFF